MIILIILIGHTPQDFSSASIIHMRGQVATWCASSYTNAPNLPTLTSTSYLLKTQMKVQITMALKFDFSQASLYLRSGFTGHPHRCMLIKVEACPEQNFLTRAYLWQHWWFHLKPFVHILFKKSSAFFECFWNYSRFVKIKDTIGSVGTVSVEL